MSSLNIGNGHVPTHIFINYFERDMEKLKNLGELLRRTDFKVLIWLYNEVETSKLFSGDLNHNVKFIGEIQSKTNFKEKKQTLYVFF